MWIDVERMQGSTVDAMATAIDGARIVLYAVSEDYKNSQNCRMEAVRAAHVAPGISCALSRLCICVKIALVSSC